MDEVKKKGLLFSIVTVVYNAHELVESTMATIFQQTYTNYEYIVIDGNSTDGTLSIISRYLDKIDVFISEPDDGIYDAMNKAIRIASGKFINFMNCGDSFVDNQVLERIAKEITDDVDVVYGNTIIDTIVGKYLVVPGKIDNVILKHMPFCHQSSFVRTEVAKQHLFDLSYKVAADYNMFLQLYKENKIFLYVDYPVSVYQNDNKEGTSSCQRVFEAAMVNGSFAAIIKGYVRLYGRYIRSYLPESLYREYRKIKYGVNPRYKYLGC